MVTKKSFKVMEDKALTNKANIEILEANGFEYLCRAWEDKPLSAELETYTNAGEGMIIDLVEVTREKLEEYINDFDINDSVMIWWSQGFERARKMKFPFDNIKEHYKDYEAYLDRLREVAKLLK